MKNYTLRVVEETDDNITCKVPFICVTDKDKYSLVFKTDDDRYSAIDLETGQQISAHHQNLNGLFRNYPNTLGRIIESEIRVLK